MSEPAGKSTPIVKIMCPTLTCRKVLSVPKDARGQIVKCQHCQKTLRVPDGKHEGKPADKSAQAA